MSSKNVKETVISQIRQEKEKRETEKRQHEARQKNERQNLEQAINEKWPQIQKSLEEIASEIPKSSYNYELKFINSSASIKFNLGPSVTLGRGRNKTYHCSAFEEHKYSYDPYTARYICTKTYQSSATDQSISGLKYIFYAFFGDPQPKISKKYFNNADELIESYGNMIIQISRSKA